MKIFMATVAATLTLGLVAAPAMAQFKHKGSGEETKVDPNAAKRAAAADRDYKAALERIPDSKAKYDPWGGVVPADSAKKPK
jgi:hypothetical protein